MIPVPGLNVGKEWKIYFCIKQNYLGTLESVPEFVPVLSKISGGWKVVNHLPRNNLLAKKQIALIYYWSRGPQKTVMNRGVYQILRILSESLLTSQK